VQIANRCAPWKISNGAENFVLQALQFQKIVVCYKVKFKSHCNWQSVNQQVLVSSPIWGSWPDIYYPSTVTVLFFWGALSDERTGLSFYTLLALTSVVFLRSESLGTSDYILLSQILDFPFRHLLRLAGSKWRYSKLPPHERVCCKFPGWSI
jgi:hypothetical protein